MVDLLVSPSYQLQDVYAACCEEALPQSLIDDPILVLQPRMLYLVQRCLYGQEAKMYFAKKAAPLVQYWFKSQVQLMTQAGGTMAVHHGKLKGQVPDLQPYTDVLGMTHSRLCTCAMFGILLHICKMFGTLLYMCNMSEMLLGVRRMLLVGRHAVRGVSGCVNNACTP